MFNSRQLPSALIVSLMTLSASALGGGYDCNKEKAQAGQANTRKSGEVAVRVSMIQLLSNPGAYDGKLVSLKAYLMLEFEGNALYLHREDAVNDLDENGLWLKLDAKSYCAIVNKCRPRSYVLILGRFNLKNTGHMGGWNGAIEDVQACEPWPPDYSSAGIKRPER